VRWIVGHALLYVAVCLGGWLLAAASMGSVLYGLLVLATYYGFLFGLPTLLLIVVLRFVALGVSGRALGRIALTAAPLIVVALPIESPPSSQYGWQLLIQVPIQVAFALLIRPPDDFDQPTWPWWREAHRDDELLAEWGLAGPPLKARPSTWWYAGAVGVWLWGALLLVGGRPLVLWLGPVGTAIAGAALALPLVGVVVVASARLRGHRIGVPVGAVA